MKHALVLPNWVAGDDPSALVDAAVAAEGAGWDGVFLADHLVFPPPPEIGEPSELDEHLPMPDPWVSLASIASRTDRVRLGSWVTPVARKLPWQVARDLATLDRISGGRVIFGVGLGRRPDYEQFGQTWDPTTVAERTDEALALIDRFWMGQRVKFAGAHFEVNDVALLPRPVQRPRIPIVVGGLWPRRPAVRRGARWDGIMTHFPGDGVLPGDGTPARRHAAEMVDFYTSIADEPGEIFLPAHPSDDGSGWPRFAAGLGATWLYSAKMDGEWVIDSKSIERGPLV